MFDFIGTDFMESLLTVDPVVGSMNVFIADLLGFFDATGAKGMDRTKCLPKDVPLKMDVPLDIALSMLRPEELEKLRNYVTAYLAKHTHETE